MPEPAPAGKEGRERRYRVYGVTVASEFPFQTPLISAEGPPDLTFTSVAHAPVDGTWQDNEPIFESRYLTDDGDPQVRLYRHDEFQVFRQAGVADYYMWPDRIVCHQRDEAATNIVELYFLSLLTGFWLESRGIVALHASAVSVNERAVVFLATNTGGKTSLSTSLMQAGHPLLTDDFLAVSLLEDIAIGHPGFPQMRMWPDLADHFVGGHAQLPLVMAGTEKRRVRIEAEGLGSFCTEDRRLSRLYLPARSEDVDAAIRIEPVPPQEALIELVRESFLSTVLEKAGLHRERFARLASLVGQVRMARLVYPSGLDRLPEVREAILADLGADR
jgi:hypothetical protein